MSVFPPNQEINAECVFGILWVFGKIPLTEDKNGTRRVPATMNVRGAMNCATKKGRSYRKIAVGNRSNKSAPTNCSTQLSF